MRHWRWAAAGGVVLAGVVVGLAGSAVDEQDAFAQCNRTCPAGTPRDAEGCCKSAPPVKRAPAPTAPPPPASSCPADMGPLPAGSFTMGDRQDQVTVGAVCMDKTEVTTTAYTACVTSGKCTADHLGEYSFDGNSFTADVRCNYNQAGRGSHPINCVDWGQSATYCHAQGKRLPSEEEWEWAARGASAGTTYPWGNTAPDFQLCWSGISKRAGTCPVASEASGNSPQGIADLAGNVWEWTSSNLDATGAARVSRGGSWIHDDPAYVRAAIRDGNAPAVRYGGLGFRCAR